MKAISLDENFDLQAENGTLLLGETSEQNAALVVGSEKGEWKEFPQMGAGLKHLVKSVATEREIIREVNVALSFDGIKAQVTITDGNLNIEL
ncbi:MAG: hypothetical protein K5685_02960 [Bacteroidales bacterium]|nr:hypothetical protein [Bacteroidales bacterium]